MSDQHPRFSIWQLAGYLPIFLKFFHDFGDLTDSLRSDPDHPNVAPIGHDIYPFVKQFIGVTCTEPEFNDAMYALAKTVTKPK